MFTEEYGPALGSTITINAPGRVCHRKHGTVVALLLATNEATVQLENGLRYIVSWSGQTPFPHGSLAGYSRGCSCIECCDTINEYHRVRRAKGYPSGKSHGTRGRYRSGCRCDECRAASAKHTRDWRHAQRAQ